MHHVSFDFTIDTLGAVIVFNIIGTALQYLLTVVHDKYHWKWSERPLKALNFMMTMISILIANKAKPVTRPEFNDAPKPK